MVAESISARRPAFGRASARRPLRTVAAALTAAFALALAPLGAALPALAGTTPASTASARVQSATDADGVSITVAPASTTTVSAGQGLVVSVRIENKQSTALDAGVISVSMEDESIADRAALDAWLGGSSDPAAVSAAAAVTAPSGAIAPGGSLEVQLAVPAAAMPADSASGPLGLSASLSVAGNPLANDRSAVVWQGATAVPPQPLAVIVPITAPPRETGLIAVTDLENYTAPGGLLTEQLDAVIGHGVTLGVDPAIIASIRVLGSSAPESALEWLTRLEESGLAMFALAYADADLAAQAQAGLTMTLPVTGLPINPDLFTEMPVVPSTAPSTAPATVPTPTATPTPDGTDTPTLPTSEQLLAGPWTHDSFAWPAAGTLTEDDPAVLAASGYSAMLLDSSNVTDFTPGFSAPRTTVGGVVTVVADSGASTLLGAAASAPNELSWRAAIAELASTLAVSGENGTVLAVPRDGSARAARFSAVLDALSALPWATPSDLSGTLASPASANLAIAPLPETPERVSLASRMIATEPAIAEFSSVLETPATLTDAVRLELLALLSNAWLPDAVGFTEAANAFIVRTTGVANAVTFAESSTVLVVATTAEIPITVQNSFTEPVTVVVAVVPTNGRLIVDNEITATIQPESQSTVRIPVNARIGSGDVTLNATVLSPTGVRLANTSVHVNVQADWEGIGALIVAILAVLFFGFGVVRTVRRRRADRATAGATRDAGGTDTDEAPETPDPETAEAGSSDAAADPKPDGTGE